jgi:hypothetical protein
MKVQHDVLTHYLILILRKNTKQIPIEGHATKYLITSFNCQGH